MSLKLTARHDRLNQTWWGHWGLDWDLDTLLPNTCTTVT